MPSEDQNNRRQRNGGEHADEAEDLAQRRERQQGCERMQADALADEFGCDEESLQGSAENHDHPRGDDSGPGVELLNGDEGGQGKSDERADIGNENQGAGEEADGEGEVQADQREGGGVEERHHRHHGELSVQEFAEDIVEVAGDGEGFLAEARREGGGEFSADDVAVAHEVKHCEGGDDQGEGEGGEGVDAGAEEVEGEGCGGFCAVQSDGLGGVLGGLFGVEVLEALDDFGVLGAEPLHDGFGGGGEHCAELGGLGRHQGGDGERGGDYQGEEQDGDDGGGGPRGEVAAFQLCGGGRGDISGDGGQDEGDEGFGGGVYEPSRRQDGKGKSGESDGGH